MNPPPKALVAIAAACAMLVVFIGGCDPDRPAAAPIVSDPQGLKTELQTLRDPNGLFIYPGYYRQPGSVYSTALVGAALGGWQLTTRQTNVASAAVCHGSEPKIVHPAWLGWAVSEILGRGVLNSAAKACITTTAPTPTGDPTADIPLLWAWAQASANLKQPRSQIATTVKARLEGLAVEAVKSPYVRWRLDQLEHLIGAPDTAAIHVAPPPPRLAEPTDLLDLWGYTERCAAHRKLCVKAGVPNFEAVDAAERLFGDDLSLAAAIGIARIQRNDSAIAAYRMALAARIDPSTGLIRSARPEGDIASTFLVLQLAPDLIRGPRAAATAQVMKDDLELGPKIDDVTRMKAIAILKALGDPAWTGYRQQVTANVNELTSAPVTVSSLQSKVDLIEALRLLEPNVPLVTLTIFATNDARSQHLARLALAYADIFANADALRSAFSGVRSRLVSVASQPVEPLVSYFTAANAINGSSIQLDAADHQRIVKGMRTVQGCTMNGKDYAYLFRSSLESRESCSLEATWQAMRSSFAYGGSR